MNRSFPLFAAACAAILLAACAPSRSVVVQPMHGARAVRSGVTYAAAPGGDYRVVKGDTLYSIAFRHGVDVRSLAGWNSIAAPYTIWPGQVLRLSPSGRSSTGLVTRTPAPAVAPAPAAALPPHAAAAPSRPVQQPVFQPAPTPRAAASQASSSGTASASAHKPARSPVAATVAPTTSTTVPVAGEPSPPLPLPAPAPPVAAAASAGGSRAIGGVSWRWPAAGSVFKGFKAGDAIPGIEIAGTAGEPVRAAADGVVVYSGNGLVGYGELIIIKHNDSFLSAYGHNRKRLVKEGQKVTAGQQIAEMGSTGAPRVELEFQIRKNGNPVDPTEFLPRR